MALTYYETLGVGPMASTDVIHRSYMERAAAATTGPPDSIRLGELHEAWNTLGDPAARSRYDTSLAPQPDPQAAARRRDRDVAAQPCLRTQGTPPQASEIFAEVLAEYVISQSALGALQLGRPWFPGHVVPGGLTRALFLEFASFNLLTVCEAMERNWPSPTSHYLWGIALGRAVKEARRLKKRDFRYGGQRIDRWVPIEAKALVGLQAARAAEYRTLIPEESTDPLIERLKLDLIREATGIARQPHADDPSRGRISVATDYILAAATDQLDLDLSPCSTDVVDVWAMLSISFGTFSRLVAGATADT